MSLVLHRARFWIDHRWAPGHMSDFLDADLGAARRGRMERHLGECEACRHLLAGLRAVLAALRALPAAGSSADGDRISASVRVKLRQAPAPH